MNGLTDNQQAVAVIGGVALCAIGVYESIKSNADAGATLVAAGLALLGYKETAGSRAPAPSTTPPNTT